jgi:hypothetical protein
MTMRFTTIWTLPAMTLRERLNRTGEWAAIKVAWALPRRVLYWSAVRAAVTVEPSSDPSGVTVSQMMATIGHD